MGTARADRSALLPLEGLLQDGSLTAGLEVGVVRTGLVLPLLLRAARDGGPHVLGLVAERVHEVEGVRTQPRAQSIDVARHRRRPRAHEP